MPESNLPPQAVAWIYLIIAGLCEVVWAIGLKYADGFTKLWPSVVTIAFFAASAFLLSRALRTLPVGTGYAAWTGIGAVGTAILGIILFSESHSLPRLGAIALIVIGIVGLKVAG